MVPRLASEPAPVLVTLTVPVAGVVVADPSDAKKETVPALSESTGSSILKSTLTAIVPGAPGALSVTTA
jgi:hypothetical protein